MLSFIIRISILSFFILSYVLWVKAFRMKVNLRKIESSSLFYRQNWSLENARVFTWHYIRLVEVNWNTVLWALLFQYIQAMYTKYCFVRAGKKSQGCDSGGSLFCCIYVCIYMYAYMCVYGNKICKYTKYMYNIHPLKIEIFFP